MTEDELEAVEQEARARQPDPANLVRGEEAHRLRRERLLRAAAKQQVTIRLDADVIDRFKALAGADGSYQSIINRALIQWLDAQDLRSLLHGEIDALREAIKRLESRDAPVAP